MKRQLLFLIAMAVMLVGQNVVFASGAKAAAAGAIPAENVGGGGAAEVPAHIKKFAQIEDQLIDLGIRYSLLFPINNGSAAIVIFLNKDTKVLDVSKFTVDDDNNAMLDEGFGKGGHVSIDLGQYKLKSLFISGGIVEDQDFIILIGGELALRLSDNGKKLKEIPYPQGPVTKFVP